ncbi:MAG: exosortase A [Pseudomonadota bacterium]
MSMLNPASSTPVAEVRPVTGAWRSAGPLFLLLLAVLLALYWDTARSMAEIWLRSETFAHGLLVVPIFTWLVWRKRVALSNVSPQPCLWGLAALALSLAGWLAAEVAGVQVVRQLAFVASIPALIIAVLGWRIAWVIAYPLAFLFLGVPMGENLMLPLMNFTADFTVGALQLLNFPVYREGTFFELPSGSWSVVEACSGLRYLISSVTVGALFAYVSYRSIWRRAAFIVASFVVPVIANGFRALMIVLLAHYSDMKIATGVDHIIYGWVFFGVIMLLLFWVGSFWQEREAEDVPPEAGSAAWRPVSTFRTAAVGIAAAALLAGPLLYVAQLAQRPLPPLPGLVLPVEPGAGWTLDEGVALTDWRPTFQNPDREATLQYRRNDEVIVVHLAWYGRQRQDAELINSGNYMIEQEHDVWSNVGERIVSSSPHALRETELRSSRLRLLIHDWYVVGDTPTANGVIAKLLFARNLLLTRDDAGYGVVLYTPQSEDRAKSRALLREFAALLEPTIDKAVSP